MTGLSKINNHLTIIVPTYNRCDDLRVLLNRLACEIGELGKQVQVIIGDNASSDSTKLVVQEFIAQCPNTKYLRHTSNCGPDENFCRCVEMVSSEYFWIIGDDDLPKRGVIKRVELLLIAQNPDFVYLSNRWVDNPGKSNSDISVTELNGFKMQRSDFARKLNIWFTFISSCIIRTTHARSVNIRKYLNTHLVQLGWVYQSIIEGEDFIFIQTESVLARSANTGGYSLLKVFFQNFPAITSEMFGATKDLREIGCGIQNRVNVSYLPNLIRGYRSNRLGKFNPNESIPCFKTSGNSVVIRILLSSALLSESKLRVFLSQTILRCFLIITFGFDRIRNLAHRQRGIRI
jgi:glycosyltransferase involved in cell wall biosynthesis